MNSFRNTIVIAVLILSTLDFFHHFVTLSHGWRMIGRVPFLSFGLSAAISGGAIIAHAMLSLWEGTPFVKSLIDFEPDSTSPGRYGL